MCNERDRLIAYIYDECDATERDAVRQHLDTCDECRVEVTALRTVREDLLAWDVPAHGSVWQPFAPPKPSVWWRQVPTWALAAAASIVLLSGAVGGAAPHAFMVDTAHNTTVAQADNASTQIVRQPCCRHQCAPPTAPPHCDQCSWSARAFLQSCHRPACPS